MCSVFVRVFLGACAFTLGVLIETLCVLGVCAFFLCVCVCERECVCGGGGGGEE